MKNAKEYIKNDNLTDLKVEYFKAKKDSDFKDFTDKIDLKDDYLMKYTSLLKQCCEENKNCKTGSGERQIRQGTERTPNEHTGATGHSECYGRICYGRNSRTGIETGG